MHQLKKASFEETLNSNIKGGSVQSLVVCLFEFYIAVCIRLKGRQ